ncbi:MAG: hypothetical protein JXA28_02170 [Bacteroidetes bacterium]|nr:hypothetical protein [Bacteroidota bacterium]
MSTRSIRQIVLVVAIPLSFCIMVPAAVAQDIDPPLSGKINIDSEPRGAEVFLGDSLLGRTPLRIDTAIMRDVRLYWPSRLSWDAQEQGLPLQFLAADQGVVLVRFEMRDWRRMLLGEISPDGEGNRQVGFRRTALRFPSARVLFPAGLGLAAGVAAVILKQKADALYEDYLVSGDDALLSQTKKYDIYAGISLALLQVGLGYVIYLVLDE